MTRAIVTGGASGIGAGISSTGSVAAGTAVHGSFWFFFWPKYTPAPIAPSTPAACWTRRRRTAERFDPRPPVRTYTG